MTIWQASIKTPWTKSAQRKRLFIGSRLLYVNFKGTRQTSV